MDVPYNSDFQQMEQYNKDTTSQGIHNAYDYSLLTGKPYNQDDIFRLVDIKANFIILDFWYSSCYPCIKGIPSVNKLYRDYKDKGVAVYGVNMIDDEVKSKARLEKFFKNNHMEYPPVIVDPIKSTEIGINAYPTLLVLNKDYQIVFMEDGFSEHLYEKVSAFLDANL
jgi:thiol-disulfide isomerase/thioredoxin